jgi:hypothetical protein
MASDYPQYHRAPRPAYPPLRLALSKKELLAPSLANFQTLLYLKSLYDKRKQLLFLNLGCTA